MRKSWKISYIDMLTVLMTFFLLLWALAKTDDKEKVIKIFSRQWNLVEHHMKKEFVEIGSAGGGLAINIKNDAGIFEKNSDVLINTEHWQNNLLTLLQYYYYNIEIIGHCSGDEQDCWNLAYKRAVKLKNWLKQHGVQTHKISSGGVGKLYKDQYYQGNRYLSIVIKN